jgi:enamine deaminase RidA (YjgF/YER057c/UK114 family)
MDQHQIYPGSLIRHNIFLNINDQSLYEKIKPKLEIIAKRNFPLPLVVNLIAQNPVEGELALESTYIQSSQWNCFSKENKYGACQLLKKGDYELVLGSVQVNKYSDIKKSTEKAFEKMESLLSNCGLTLKDIVRQWNYIEHLLDNEFDAQRYQTFNDVRTEQYGDLFSDTGYPASTEIGISTGGLIIEFLAVKNRKELSFSINNPIQKAPHEYSSKVLSTPGDHSYLSPTTPKLERARSLKIENSTMLLVSGTSSIIGERITAKGDAKEQTIIIIENLKKLIAPKNIEKTGITTSTNSSFSLIKVYLQNINDYKDVHPILESFFGDIPLLMVQTDLPRKGILVELEAELILQEGE